MDIKVKQLGRVMLVSLDGELDLAAAPRVRAAVDEAIEADAKINCLVWDLAQVDFIDSSGLGVLLGRYNKMKSRDGQVVVASAPGPLRRMLAMAGLERIIRLVNSNEQALSEIGGGF